MCTGIYRFGEHPLFGRNLDLDMSYGEKPLFVPRGASIPTHHEGSIAPSYAMLGTGLYLFGRPLYFDAMNEKGLAVAGLNFPGYAREGKMVEGKVNLTPYEFIPYLLGGYATLEEAMPFLQKLNFTDEAVDSSMPIAPLHYLIADLHSAIVLEATADGVHVYQNPYGVLTNNPPFPIQSFRLHDYLNLSAAEPTNQFAPTLDLKPYCHGLGAHGLPGDLSSGSRFVKAAFTRLNSVSAPDELSSVSQFFHILHSVDQPRGSSRFGTPDDPKYEITIYSSCCNLRTGVYYYTCYDNHQITAVDLHRVDLDGTDLSRYPLITTEQIAQQN